MDCRKLELLGWKTTREHRVWVGNFIAIAGNRPLDQYTKSDGRAFKSVLLKLPPNWNKHKQLKSLDIGTSAEQAHKLGLEPMSHSNVNKLLQFVGSFWRWAESNYDNCSANPVKGLTIRTRTSARDERDPFVIEELQTIFTAPLYTGCRSKHFWKQPGTSSLRNTGVFWVPLIALYSGARLGEIIQLYVEDIREEGRIFFLILMTMEKISISKTFRLVARCPYTICL